MLAQVMTCSVTFIYMGSMTRLAKVAENSAASQDTSAPQQFDSEWNVGEENRTWLGPETLAQLPDGMVPDAVVGGVGTGGTIVGVGRRCFRETQAHPAGSSPSSLNESVHADVRGGGA